MSLLRIYGSLVDPAQHCQWALVTDHREPFVGMGSLADLPQGVERVQLVIPAAQVLITRARIPHSARRGAASALAFAVEEKTAAEPDANQVSWLGSVNDEDVLAVVDKQGLARWIEALATIGIRVDEVHCETLLLPVTAGAWSVAWNGSEGLVRTGAFEGAALDSGDRESPPLSLLLMLEEAKTHHTMPELIMLYTTTADAIPDIAAWQRALGITVHSAGIWSWHSAAPDAGVSLVQQRQRWRFLAGAAVRLRPAAWLLGAALTIHAAALVTDWTLLASEQRTLRQQMETQFRSTFPDAVAVADPVLQMRRKLADARHNAGVADSGDFVPMIGQIAAATRGLPVGTLQSVSYESGRIMLALAPSEAATVQRIVGRLTQSGLSVDTAAPVTQGASAQTVLIVSAS